MEEIRLGTAEASAGGSPRPALEPHDINTPIHAIRGNIELILSSEGLRLSIDGRTSLQQILAALNDLETALRRADLLLPSERF